MNIEETIWYRGRLDKRSGPQQLMFGRMYEDSSIETRTFNNGGRIMCIASAGCTALKLAQSHEVVAVDLNSAQLGYTAARLKGEHATPGTIEQLLGLIRVLGVIAGWRPSRIRKFLDLSDTGEQLEYWNKHLNTRRFRMTFDLLLSVTLLGRVYHKRLVESIPKPFGPILRSRMERCFEKHANCNNIYARSMLLGEWTPEPVPRRADDVCLVNADAAVFLENEPPGSYDGFAISNILDGAGEGYCKRLFTAIKHSSRPGAKVVLRSFADIESESRCNIAAEDRSFLWGSVIVKPTSEL